MNQHCLMIVRIVRLGISVWQIVKHNNQIWIINSARYIKPSLVIKNSNHHSSNTNHHYHNHSRSNSRSQDVASENNQAPMEQEVILKGDNCHIINIVLMMFIHFIEKSSDSIVHCCKFKHIISYKESKPIN